MGGLVATQWLPLVVGHEVWLHTDASRQYGLCCQPRSHGPSLWMEHFHDVHFRSDTRSHSIRQMAPSLLTQSSPLFYASRLFHKVRHLPPLSCVSPSTNLVTLLLMDKNRIACSSKSPFSALCRACAQSECNLRKRYDVTLFPSLNSKLCYILFLIFNISCHGFYVYPRLRQLKASYTDFT